MIRDKIAVVLTAAGEGRRLAPLTGVFPKAFVPVALDQLGRPETAMHRLLRQLRAAGLPQVWIAGTSHPWFTLLAERDGAIRTVSPPPAGEWLAVKACVDAGLGIRPLVVVSTDNVFDDADLFGFIQAAATSGFQCLVGAAYVEDSDGFTVLETSDDRIIGLTEKPDDKQSGLAKAGLYYFTAEGLRLALSRPIRKDRFDEFSVTETLQGLVQSGVILRTYRLKHNFYDIGTPSGLAKAVKAHTDGRH